MEVAVTKGIDGEKGDKGDDGVGITKIEINDNGELIITLSDNSQDNLGVIKGAKGDKGDTGEKGEKGEKGDTGATGDKGEKGDKGDTGATGDKGDKGDTGATGEKGDKGDTGAAGAKGDKGDTGAAGAKGDKGDTGATGIGVEDIYINDSGELIVVLSSGATKNLGVIAHNGTAGNDGADGANGKDTSVETEEKTNSDINNVVNNSANNENISSISAVIDENGYLILTLNDGFVCVAGRVQDGILYAMYEGEASLEANTDNSSKASNNWLAILAIVLSVSSLAWNIVATVLKKRNS